MGNGMRRERDGFEEKRGPVMPTEEKVKLKSYRWKSFLYFFIY